MGQVGQTDEPADAQQLRPQGRTGTCTPDQEIKEITTTWKHKKLMRECGFLLCQARPRDGWVFRRRGGEVEWVGFGSYWQELFKITKAHLLDNL